MLEFLQIYGALILIGLSLVAILILILALRRIAVLQNGLLVNRFTLYAFTEHDMDSDRDMISFMVSNRSLYDNSVEQLGIAVADRHFNLRGRFINIAPDDRMLISQRRSVKYSIPADELEMLLHEEKRSARGRRVRIYGIDTSGVRYTASGRCVARLMKERFAKDAAAAAAEARQEFIALYLEREESGTKIPFAARMRMKKYRRAEKKAALAAAEQAAAAAARARAGAGELSAFGNRKPWEAEKTTGAAGSAEAGAAAFNALQEAEGTAGAADADSCGADRTAEPSDATAADSGETLPTETDPSADNGGADRH